MKNTIRIILLLLCMTCLCSCGTVQQDTNIEDKPSVKEEETLSVQNDSSNVIEVEPSDDAAVFSGDTILEKAQQAHEKGMLISAGFKHLVGVKMDGTVVATGWNDDGQCNTSELDSIIMVSAGHDNTIGLKKDGTVTSVGSSGRGNGVRKGDISDWSDIIAVSAGMQHTVGLRSDGTVVAVCNDLDNYNGICDVDSWTDIVQISAGTDHTVGLKSDGTVVATGGNGYGQCDVSEWTDIVAVSAGEMYTLGLKKDGTVISTEYMKYDFTKWSDVIAIDAGNIHAAAIKADGTLLLTNNYDTGVHNAIAVSAGGVGTTIVLTDDYNVINMGLESYDTSEWRLN